MAKLVKKRDEYEISDTELIPGDQINFNLDGVNITGTIQRLKKNMFGKLRFLMSFNTNVRNNGNILYTYTSLKWIGFKKMVSIYKLKDV